MHRMSQYVCVGVALAGAWTLRSRAGGDTNAVDYWPQWRGPLGTGEAPRANPPVEGSEARNVRWKLALPGKGHSTPVLWDHRLFLTAAVPVGAALPPK